MSESEDQAAYRVMIEGRVQGVGFRYSTRQKAARLGLTGYVRNCSDGTVEVVCEGRERDVGRLLSWLKKGPPGANVTGAEPQRVRPTGLFRDFSIEY